MGDSTIRRLLLEMTPELIKTNGGIATKSGIFFLRPMQ